MIDRLLNYGRSSIAEFAALAEPVSKALDIGAGPGSDLGIVKSIYPAADVVGIEGFAIFREMLAAANVKSVSIDIERDVFPFADESFDLVMANQVLEHVKEIFWIFHNATRVLKVGGHLVIGVPNLASLHNRLLLLVGRQPTSIGNNSAHIRGYTRMDMLRLLECGFPRGYQLRKSRGGNFYPFPPFIARPLATMFPGMAVSFFLLLRKTRKYDGSFLRYPVEKQLNSNFFVGGPDAQWTFNDRTSE